MASLDAPIATQPSSTNMTVSNFPNPFTDRTTINFSVSKTSFVQATITNLLGSETAELFSGKLSAGEYSFKWGAGAMPPGMYNCILLINGQKKLLSLMLLR